ncbi:hypothetical protein BDW67DRAFT_171418 [Aspergillus spinulosporus]
MTLNAAQKTNLSVTWILGGIATLTVFSRLYVRFFQQRTTGWDDYVMILCWTYSEKCLAITSASLASTAIHYGLGVDLYDIHSPDDRVNALKYLTLAPNPSILSVAFGKLLIVLFFHRLLDVSMTRMLLAGLSISAVVAVLAFCTPTKSIWDKTVPAKHCMAPETQLRISLAQASFNAFTDIILGLLPAYSFYNLQMPLHRKIGLMLLFGVGVFGCVITSIKVWQLRNLTGHDNLTMQRYEQPHPNSQPYRPLTKIQMFVLITCANIPMIRLLFQCILKIQSSTRALYPLESTPRNKSLSARTKNQYFSLGNSQGNTQSSVSAGWGTRRNSVDRMYPLTRQDSPPSSGPDRGGETGSQKGIVKGTEFSVSYSS